jgi:MFS transporter, PHS family, inorganic phosphate transporter
MMATVFLMQPLGQLVSSVVSLLAATGLKSQYNGFPDKAVDQLWRTVLGVGAVPALWAAIFHLTIPESPRYILDVRQNSKEAVSLTQLYFGPHAHALEMPSYPPSIDLSDNGLPLESHHASELPYSLELPAEGESRVPTRQARFVVNNGSRDRYVHEAINDIGYYPEQFSNSDLKRYFLDDGNWRYLLATSICWFFLNLTLWGLGTNNPRTLARLWNQSLSEEVAIYDQIGDYAKRSIITVSVGSITGSLCLLTIINIVPRKQLLIGAFVWLAVLLAVTGSIIISPSRSISALVVTFYALCFFNINFCKQSYNLYLNVRL